MTIETLVDSGATHPLLDTLTCEEAGVQINTQDSSSFAVASGPDFVTAGTTKEPIPFETESTDHEPMVLNVHQGHVADLGGKKGGKAKAPELSPEEAAALRREQQIAAKAELRRRMEEEAKNSKINSLKILK